MAKYCLLVLTTPVPGRDEEFNDWYTNQHVPDVLKIPGFVGAKRYKITHDSNLPGKYVAIYEIEADDPQTVIAELRKRSNTPAMIMSDAFDSSTASMSLCAQIG